MSKMDHAPLTTVHWGQNGAALSCDTTAKVTTIPTSRAGTTAKYVRIATSGGGGYVRLDGSAGAATTVAVTTDCLFVGGYVEIWPVNGATHFSYASLAGTTVCVVTAVEFG